LYKKTVFGFNIFDGITLVVKIKDEPIWFVFFCFSILAKGLG